jgi:hypothetical protein
MGTSGNNSERTFAELMNRATLPEIFHPNSQVLQNHWANESPG